MKLRNGIFLSQILLIGFFQFPYILASELSLVYNSKPEQKFFENWFINQSNYDTLAGWFIANGTQEEEILIKYKTECENNISILKAKIENEQNTKKRAEKIFKFFHKELLKEIDPEADFSDLFKPM